MSGVTGAIIGGSLIGAGASIYGAKKAGKAVQAGADAATAEGGRQFDLVREDTAKLRGLGDAATDRISRLFGYAQTPSNAAAAQPMSREEFIASRGGIGGFDPRGSGMLPRMLSGVAGAHRSYDDYIANFKPEIAPALTAPSSGPDMSVFFESPDYQFRVGETQKALDRMGSARGRFASGAALKEGSRYASNLASGEFASFYDRLAQQAGLGVTGIGQSAAAGSNFANMAGNAAMSAGNNRANAYAAGVQGVNASLQGGLSNWTLMNYLKQQPGNPMYATQYPGRPV